MMIPGFTITGLFPPDFHRGEKAALWLWSSNYVWYALSAVGRFYLRFLVDRFSAYHVPVAYAAPMLFACLVAWWG